MSLSFYSVKVLPKIGNILKAIVIYIILMCRELETVKKEEAKLKTELAQVNMPA
jgi:hypothetical protein